MPRKYVILLVLTLGVVLLDHWSKYVAVRELTTRFDGQVTLSARLGALYGEPPEEGYDGNHFRSRRMVTVSDDFFRFRYAENKGAAFSLFGNLPPHIRGPFFHLVSIGAVFLIVAYYRKVVPGAPGAKWQLYGLPLVLGGALGNYVDRLARGFVIDFAEAHWFHKAYWPAFNVADAAICIGVGMLLLDGLLHREHKAAAGASSP